MNWTDIEAKWTAMTRRVQSDQSWDGDDTVITRASEQPLLPPEELTELRAPASLDRPAT